MKMGKKCWWMKSLTGVILVCIFLTACGGETQETESKSTVQENETVSTASTVEPADEQTQEAVQEAENFVQTDNILENLKGKRDPQAILQELSELPLNIEELKAYPVYVLSDQFEECSGQNC